MIIDRNLTSNGTSDHPARQNAAVMVQKLLEIYDTDHSGLVEESEFLEFLKGIADYFDKAANHQEAFSFYALRDEGASSGSSGSSGICHPYVPPAHGTLLLRLVQNRVIPDFVPTISSKALGSIIDSTRYAYTYA
jgi:hypothetical protein